MNSPSRLLWLIDEAGAALFLCSFIRRLKQSHGPWQGLLGDGAFGFLERRKLLCNDKTQKLLKRQAEKQIDMVVADLKPELILCSLTPTMNESLLLKKARTLNIPSVGVIDSWYNYKHRWSGVVPKPDYLLLADRQAYDEATAEGVPSECIRIVGHSGLETIQRRPSGNFRKVLFVTQPIKQAYGKRLSYDEQVAWTLVQQLHNERPDVISNLGFALHPAMSIPSYLKSNNFRIETNAASCLDNYGTVIGMFSAIMIESWLAGKKTISVQPGLPIYDMCPLSRSGKIDRVGSCDQLLQSLLSDGGVFKGQNPFAGSSKKLDNFLCTELSFNVGQKA